MKPVLALLVALFAIPGALALVTDPLQNDAGTGNDAGDSAADATLLGQPYGSQAGDYAGTLVPVDDPQDWYAIVAPTPLPGGSLPLRLVLTADPTMCALGAGTNSGVFPQGSIHLVLYDPHGAPRASTSASCTSPGELGARLETPGIWRVQLTGSFGIAVPAMTATSSSGQAISPFGYGFDLECQPWC